MGKTALINQFIKDKKAIYFMGVESNAKQNLENFSKNIMEYGSGIQTETAFLSFQAALQYVFQLAEDERLILAIDEYPYAARLCLIWKIMCWPIRRRFMAGERRR